MIFRREDFKVTTKNVILKVWYYFLYLQIVMKQVIIKMLAVMLTVWYSMSIIGFDVHTCSGSGRSFVVTFMEGLTCEDIHPEHSCAAAPCCGNSHEEHCCDDVSIGAKSCCSNDYRALEITGILVSDDHHHYDECFCGHCPCVGSTVSEIVRTYTEGITIAYIHEPDSGFGKACERQAALRVWRI